MRKMKLIYWVVAVVVAMIFLSWGICPAVAEAMSGKRKNVPEFFGIATSSLSGGKLKVILKDPKREMNHARVSNDHKWITFTRYNKLNRKGVAVEEGGYENTEIMLCRIDGSELQTLVPPKKGVINGNGNWTPDNKGIVYVSTDNPEKKPQILVIDIATRKISRLPVPEKYYPTDPHMVGNLLVYPAKTRRFRQNRIFLMQSDGTHVKQLTLREARSMGDHDPKLSPDKSKVALLRRYGKKEWHIVVVNVETGMEKDLSMPFVAEDADLVPEWSSDSRLLVYFHLNWKAPIHTNGLYTIRPDGTGRRKIPLPKGYFYTMPAFFPGTGSGKDAQIIFSVRKLPGIPVGYK